MSRLPLMLLLLPAIGCSSEPAAPAVSVPFTPQATAPSGTISTPLGRATFADPQGETFKVKRITGDWHVEVKAKPGFDLAVQEIDFAPGSWSGWHTHPGPVFIQVVTGEMTFYEADDPDCEPIVRSAGQGILDVGEHAHIARNETTESAKNLVVYLVPPGAPALRFDAPDPGHCPFTN
jgi:quercetin dioxygenase-like cupin family protein